MLDRFLLFGATGDLAARFLFPGLASLAAAGRLPGGFAVYATGREPWSDELFRQHLADRLRQHAGELPAAVRDEMVRRVRYRKVDFGDPKTLADLAGDRPVAAYLALPPSQFPHAVDALLRAGLAPGSRVAIEKPFGENLEAAERLNALLAKVPGGERAVFRVDHVLGMATVQNLIGLRLANHAFDALWSSAHVEQLEVLWEETLALEDRAGFYDRTGALRDVMQNHMMQVLAIAAMEPPASLGVDDLRRAKLELLRAVRPPAPADLATRTRRARYGAGSVGDRRLPAYEQESGVDGRRGTETFAEVVFEIGNPRWAGTRVVLRAGKALAERKKEVVLRFRPQSRWPFAGAPIFASELHVGIDGPYGVGLSLTGMCRDPAVSPTRFVLEGAPPASELPAYARVLLDLLEGGGDLALSAGEVEQAWRIVTPIVRAWAAGDVPLGTYPAGSAGP